MDNKALKAELDATQKSLTKADIQIKNLLVERKQQKMTIELLEAGGFITEGKLEQAREFIQQFKSQ